jgi:hypothetical protein
MPNGASDPDAPLIRFVVWRSKTTNLVEMAFFLLDAMNNLTRSGY